jgi:Protein of unknown function (DUF3106)
MPFFDIHRRFVNAPTRFTAVTLVMLVLCAPLQNQAQTQTAQVSTVPQIAAASVVVSVAPRWAALSPVQRQSLLPLSGTWDSLSEAHRRKWIALAQNYASLAPPEQEKLHARMVEWAALKPKEREQARLNFAQTKQLAPKERTANWDAYQALSAEEREKLASGVQNKPVGAAVAVKPVVSQRLTVIPIAPTKSPETKPALVTKPQSLNPNTLLPLVLGNPTGAQKP